MTQRLSSQKRNFKAGVQCAESPALPDFQAAPPRILPAAQLTLCRTGCCLSSCCGLCKRARPVPLSPFDDEDLVRSMSFRWPSWLWRTRTCDRLGDLRALWTRAVKAGPRWGRGGHCAQASCNQMRTAFSCPLWDITPASQAQFGLLGCVVKSMVTQEWVIPHGHLGLFFVRHSSAETVKCYLSVVCLFWDFEQSQQHILRRSSTN